jgi:hypothetical protein
VTLWNGILWLHLVAMAFFVGGQLMLAAVVVPVLRGREEGVPLRAAARRFGFGTLAAILARDRGRGLRRGVARQRAVGSLGIWA